MITNMNLRKELTMKERLQKQIENLELDNVEIVLNNIENKLIHQIKNI